MTRLCGGKSAVYSEVGWASAVRLDVHTPFLLVQAESFQCTGLAQVLDLLFVNEEPKHSPRLVKFSDAMSSMQRIWRFFSCDALCRDHELGICFNLLEVRCLLVLPKPFRMPTTTFSKFKV
eukprot:Skav212348  [mRNA]  locus=scaffold1488:295344:299342:- [translate_table: standard]